MTFQVIQMPPRTLTWWRDEREDVDLEPVYQRKGHVWQERQKQYLIDSIMNGFDIPKLYMADFTFLNSALNAGRKKYAVIDGKQRLLAIYDFFQDDVSLPKGFVYFDEPKLELGGFCYSDLVKNYPKIARKFDNYSLTVMSVITDDESKINELFVRLNSSKPLTGAELRNAMGGRLPDIIRDLITHEFFSSRIRFSVSRSQDKNTAAKLLLLEHRGTIVDTKKAQLDALTKEFAETEAELASAEELEMDDLVLEALEETESTAIDRSAAKMRAVLDAMVTIFVPTDPLLRQQAQVVVIYWLVRELSQSEYRRVRPFLLAFETDRQAQKHLGATTDHELAEYELMARTSNDAYSIRRRVQILEKRFAQYSRD